MVAVGSRRVGQPSCARTAAGQAQCAALSPVALAGRSPCDSRRPRCTEHSPHGSGGPEADTGSQATLDLPPAGHCVPPAHVRVVPVEREALKEVDAMTQCVLLAELDPCFALNPPPLPLIISLNSSYPPTPPIPVQPASPVLIVVTIEGVGRERERAREVKR